MNVTEAKAALDSIIKKSRVHLYKPIQIAEILHRDRLTNDIDLENLNTYRNASKAWRDVITNKFVGRSSTSSARYQDDIFNENAIPPQTLAILGKENREKGGIVEAYIYRRFTDRFSQMEAALQYCSDNERGTLIYRVGVTNAADRGLDMYANFGMAIQIKHLSLTPELAENIVGTVTADRIVIVCKAGEKALIVSLLNQIGWKARIQSIITKNDLENWYERALRGNFGPEIGDKILLTLREQLVAEFPASNNAEFTDFYESRNYNLLTDDMWI